MTDYKKICDFENLYQAHRKARSGKRTKTDVIAFELDLAYNLWHIKDNLENNTYRIAGYKRFVIHEPKQREIEALCYSDRIVQHSLCDNVLTPLFEKRLIYDNCACRVGKGTHFGIKRLTSFMREHYKKYGAEGWILKADIRKYFANIDHQVLIGMLQKAVPDSDIMRLLKHIIYSINQDTGKGVPMGNQTSQLFALYYLDPIDRLVKEKLRIKHYSRYMDDMILLHPDKIYLQECLIQMKNLVENTLKLEFNEKTQLFAIRNGVDYLGWHFYLTESGKVIRKLRTQNKKRLKRRLKGLQKGYAEGLLEIEDINRSMASTHGHLIHGHTWRLRQKLSDKTVFTRKNEEETK